MTKNTHEVSDEWDRQVEWMIKELFDAHNLLGLDDEDSNICDGIRALHKRLGIDLESEEALADMRKAGRRWLASRDKGLQVVRGE